MFFDFKTMDAVSFGKVSMKCDENGYSFYRYTDAQMKIWNSENPYFTEEFFDGYFYRNSIADANVKLDFSTDSRFLAINISSIKPLNKAKDCTIEVFVNSKNVLLIKEAGEYKIELKRKSRIQIFLPHFAQCFIKSVEVSDGAYVMPAKHKMRWLFIGDSITHGAGATMPTLNYPARIAKKYDLEIINQGNSGYVTDERVIERIPNWIPDIVTSAYGVNDVGRKTLEQQETEFYSYCKKLKREFPDSKIYIISPIWGQTLFGVTPYSKKREGVYKIYEDAKSLEGIEIIDGLKLVPHDAKYYLPDGNHPNDKGYSYYASRLSKIILERN